MPTLSVSTAICDLGDDLYLYDSIALHRSSSLSLALHRLLSLVIAIAAGSGESLREGAGVAHIQRACVMMGLCNKPPLKGSAPPEHGDGRRRHGLLRERYFVGAAQRKPMAWL